MWAPPESHESIWEEEKPRKGEISAKIRNDKWSELRLDGNLMITILSSFAQEESLSVSENCKWLIWDKFKQGISTNNTILGYETSCGTFKVVPKKQKS